MTPILAAIISILVGNFLVGVLFKPALEHLQKIREELISVVIPIADRRLGHRGQQPGDAQDIQTRIDSALRSMNEILRKYILDYQSFRRIGILFLAALILLFNFTVCALLIKLCGLWITAVACTLVTVATVAIARGIAPDSYPQPQDLSSLDYLCSHYSNFQPETLIRILDIGIQPPVLENSPQLCLSCAVHLTGYKFFMAMTNEEQSSLYFISYGSVSAKTKATHVIFADYYRWLIQVGTLNPAWPQGLQIPVYAHLFIFIPIPEGWNNANTSPYFMSQELWTPMPGNPHEAGVVLNMHKCNPGSVDRRITFRRRKTRLHESWEITPDFTDQNAENFRLRKLLWFYRRELESEAAIRTLTGQQLPNL